MFILFFKLKEGEKLVCVKLLRIPYPFKEINKEVNTLVKEIVYLQ